MVGFDIDCLDAGTAKRQLHAFDHMSRSVEQSFTEAGGYFHCGFCGGGGQTTFISREGWINLRNNFICNACGLSGRQRHLWAVLDRLVCPDASVAIAERVTPCYTRFASRFPRLEGFEYFGPGVPSGQRSVRSGIDVTHQDLRRLNLETGTLDALIHQDVLEHVDGADMALSEMRRVLKPGGVCLFTVPWFHFRDEGLVRAQGEGETLTHHQPPAYHGDPMNPSGGVLVYEEFGLDLFARALDAGFSSVGVNVALDPAQRLFSDNNPYDAHRVLASVIILRA